MQTARPSTSARLIAPFVLTLILVCLLCAVVVLSVLRRSSSGRVNFAIGKDEALVNVGTLGVHERHNGDLCVRVYAPAAQAINVQLHNVKETPDRPNTCSNGRRVCGTRRPHVWKRIPLVRLTRSSKHNKEWCEGVWEGTVLRRDLRNRGETALLYTLSILGADGQWRVKVDPYSRDMHHCESSCVTVNAGDEMQKTVLSKYEFASTQPREPRLSATLARAKSSENRVYEVHVLSWMQYRTQRRWVELGVHLAQYCKHMMYTHVELLGVFDHHHIHSWGYQPVTLYALNSKMGSSSDFCTFVKLMHNHGIFVVVDVVINHVATHHYGLTSFDGQSLYEMPTGHASTVWDSKWSVASLNGDSPYVRQYITGAMMSFVNTFNVDGLRLDTTDTFAGRSKGHMHYVCHLLDTLIRSFPDLIVYLEMHNRNASLTLLQKLPRPGIVRALWNGCSTHHMFHVHRNRFAPNLADLVKHCVNSLENGLKNTTVINTFSHDDLVHGNGGCVEKFKHVEEKYRFDMFKCALSAFYLLPGDKLLFMGVDIAQDIDGICSFLTPRCSGIHPHIYPAR